MGQSILDNQNELLVVLYGTKDYYSQRKPRKSKAMSSFASRYITTLIIIASIALGFAFPTIGLVWNPYLAYLLVFLMFFVTLSIEPKEIVQATRQYPVIATGLLAVFILTPLLALFAKPFFSPTTYAGTVLAFCCPSAIATTFWAKVFKGDVSVALIISTIANLISILTIPATMLIAIGTAVKVDNASMILNLSIIVLIPMTATFLLRKLVRIDWNRVNAYSSRIELALLVLLIWGAIAPGTEYARNNVAEFALLNTFMFAILALAFVLACSLAKRFGRERAVSIGIAATVKNAALSLVVGPAAFGPQILPPLIANLIAQNLLLVPAKAIMKE